MKEFYIGCSFEYTDVFPVNTSRKVKIDMCDTCFHNLNELGRRKMFDMEPIINTYYKNLESEFEDKVLRAVMSVGVDVDKPRLIQALHEGYVAGTAKSEKEHEELIFTRKFIHDHGLEFELLSEWEKYKNEKDS